MVIDCFFPNTIFFIDVLQQSQINIIMIYNHGTYIFTHVFGELDTFHLEINYF